MGLNKLIPLTKDETELIKKVFFVSLGVTLGIVLIAAGLRFFTEADGKPIAEIREKSRGKKAVSPGLDRIDIAAHKLSAKLSGSNTGKRILHLERVVSADPYDALPQLKLAEAYLSLRDVEKASNRLSTLLEMDSLPDSVMIKGKGLYGLALCYKGDQEQGLSQLEDAIERHPESGLLYCYRGMAEKVSDPFSESAEEMFARARELDGDNPYILYQSSRHLMNRKDRTRDDLIKARRFLKQASEKEPFNPRIYGRLGMVYYYLDQPELAEKNYRNSLRINPGDYNTRFNLGDLYLFSLRDTVAALKEFKETVSLNPEHVMANFRIGLLLINNRMYKEAVEYLKAAREADPRNKRVMFQLAVCYERLDMKEDALRVYQDILEHDELNFIAKNKVKQLQ